MEQGRQLRFVIPSCIFFASLFWGAVIDPSLPIRNIIQETSAGGGTAQILAITAIGIVALIALGFLISSISHCLLTFCLPMWTGAGLFDKNYRAKVSDDTLNKIGTALQHDAGEKTKFYAVSAYVHGLLKKENPEMHEWLQGRWGFFEVSVRCCIALILSLLAEWGLLIWAATSVYGAGSNPAAWLFKNLFLWWIPGALLFECLRQNALRAIDEHWNMVEYLWSEKGRKAPAKRKAPAPKKARRR